MTDPTLVHLRAGRSRLRILVTLAAVALSAVQNVGTTVANVEARVSLPAVAREAAVMVWGTAEVTPGPRQASVKISPKLIIHLHDGQVSSSGSPLVLKQRLDDGAMAVKPGEEVLLFLTDAWQAGQLETVFGPNGRFSVSSGPCPDDATLQCRLASSGFANDGLWDSTLWRSLAGAKADDERHVLQQKKDFEEHLSRLALKGVDWSGPTRARLLGLAELIPPKRVPVELVLAVASYIRSVKDDHPRTNVIHGR